MFQIRKEFRFEAAHRLVKNYEGKCRNNHGHSWIVNVHLEAVELDSKDMLIDFQDLKSLKVWIDENLDHASILWEEDPMCRYIEESGQRLYRTRKNPTSEHIAEILFQKSVELFEDERVHVLRIDVSETCTSGASVLKA